MHKALFKLLENNYTCVTYTQGLSRHVQFLYAATQLAQGHTAWQTPDCLPWSAWLHRIYNQSMQGTEQVLIHDIQRHSLWQQIIEQSSYGQQILQPHTTARQAISAWEQCNEYCLAIFPEDVYLNDDAYAFKHWADAYQQLLNDKQLIDPATLPNRLAANLNEKSARELKLVIYGFDVLTPQQEKLFNTLEAKGADIRQLSVETRNQHLSYLAAADTHREIRHMAFWCRDQLKENPHQHIGIVCPRLHAHRSKLEHALDTILDPGKLAGTETGQDKPYSIALGQPLSHYPIINTAMHILALGQPTVALSELGSLLRSPFISGAVSESNRRALFDARLREWGEPRLPLKSIFRIADKQCKAHQKCSLFIERLKTFDIHFLSSPKTRDPRGWAKTFSDWLKEFGWPGDRTLNSDEYQTIEEWKDALSKLSMLEINFEKLTYTQAIKQLGYILEHKSFQPQTGETPVQVLGETGAAGMQFDQVWFMDCHDQAWPPTQWANPFIPLSIQREANMPHAMMLTQLNAARDLTRSLVDSAKTLVFSFPRQMDDHNVQPSPLIKPYLEQATALESLPYNDYPAQLFHSQKLDTFEDNQAPSIPQGEAVGGGSSLFKDQALCPFRAFARHRLFAERLPAVDTGLDPAQRGELVHDVMEAFWYRVKDSTSLQDLSEQQLEKTIQSVIQHTLKKHTANKPDTFSKKFCELEAHRLKVLMHEWLSLERTRSAFRIRETEQWHTVNFADVQIKIKLDRIDELEKGNLVIIDYKTGRANSKEWLEERPGEPQLPLYALTTEGHVAALVFGCIKRGECKFDGMSEQEDLLPQIKTLDKEEWTTQFDQWRTRLSELAREFRQGLATVTPKNDQACRQCDLHGLCRIYEKSERFIEMEAYE